MPLRRRRDIPSSALRSFLAVCKHGTFSKAAKELHITQPAISRQIKSLQTFVSDELFRKTPGGIGLTDCGLEVQRHAQRILGSHDQINAIAGRNFEKETVVLGIQTIFARVVMSKVVDIAQVINHLHFRYDCSTAADLEFKHKSGYVDLAVMLAPQDTIRGQIVEWSEKLVWVISARHFALTERSPIPFIGRRHGTMDRKVFEVLEESDIPYEIISQSGDMSAMIEAVAAGVGIMISPQRVVPHPLVVVPDGILPSLPELRFGVYCKEGFDRTRHKKLVNSFLSAVQPPSATLIDLSGSKRDDEREIRVIGYRHRQQSRP
jgi:DNA-binding transcriptional LysR family regulator